MIEPALFHTIQCYFSFAGYYYSKVLIPIRCAFLKQTNNRAIVTSMASMAKRLGDYGSYGSAIRGIA
jgi:hypothetical protein